MKTWAKFGILVVAIVGTLVWLAAGGISETKTYYKTIAGMQQMGHQAPHKKTRWGGRLAATARRRHITKPSRNCSRWAIGRSTRRFGWAATSLPDPSSAMGRMYILHSRR